MKEPSSKYFFFKISKWLQLLLLLLAKIFVQVLLFLIKFYQLFVSSAISHRCRFVPSCSNYAAHSLKKYGLLGGLGRTALRLARCHPFCEGGYDPP